MRAAGCSSCSVCSASRRQSALWPCMLACEDKLPKCVEGDVNESKCGCLRAQVYAGLCSRLRICELHLCISQPRAVVGRSPKCLCSVLLQRSSTKPTQQDTVPSLQVKSAHCA